MKKLLCWVHGSVRLPESRAGIEPFGTPERETWLGRTGLPSLAALGLLCHLLIFWLLSFPYTYFEVGICEVNCTSITTGWQAMGFILIFPVFPYLAYLLPTLRKNVQTEQLLTFLYLNVLVNLGGFLVIYGFLQISLHGADLHNVAWSDAAYGIHLALLLLAVVSSSVMSLVLGSRLRRSRKLRCWQSLRIANTSTPDQVVWHDRYQPGALLGSGGFSAVYRAKDRQEGGRDVAIKRISLQGLNAEATIEAINTFHREVSMLSALSHPQVPRLYDHFNDQDHCYLVLEYLEGQTLEAFLTTHETSGQPLQLAEILTMVLQLCTVLDYLHRRQPPIIFRDLKPSNILRTFAGKLYLIDFGIARRYQPGQPRDTQRLGSPGYAAPEQYGKTQTTPQSDIYSLGALLHQLLSGEDPAETPFRFAPLRLYGTAGLAELEALIMRMVDMDPGKRPASTAEVKEEMQRIVMFRMLQTNEGPRIWRPGRSQDLPAEFPPAPWQMITAGSGQQQQQQVHVPQAGLSRRKVLLGGLLTGAALVAGTEGLLWFPQSSGSRPKSPAPVLKAVPTQQPAYHQLAQLVYHGHAGFVWSVAWSPDGQFIASTSNDNTVQVWQAASGKRVSVYDTSSAHAAAWSPNGRLIAFTDGGAVQGRNPFPSNSGSQFSYSVDPVGTWSVAWSPDGERIAVGSYSGVEILNVANGEVVFKHDRSDAVVTAVTWSPDGRSIAWGSSFYSTVEVWEVATNRHAYVYNGSRKDNATATAWSPDGKYLAFGISGTVQVWETARWSLVYTFSWSGQRVEAVAWSLDSKHFASAGSPDPTIYVIDVTNPWRAYTFRGHTIGVESLAWSPDGKRIASGGMDQTVQVWEPR
jgi:hypothetical protein